MFIYSCMTFLVSTSIGICAGNNQVKLKSYIGRYSYLSLEIPYHSVVGGQQVIFI